MFDEVRNHYDMFKNNLSGTLYSGSSSSFSQFGIEYKLNNFGYRSDDFNYNNQEVILFSGCSFTFGAGIPYDYIWTKQLSEKYNMPLNSLAAPGRDYQVIINEIYKYIDFFGKPKAVAIMFPNVERHRKIALYNNQKAYDIEPVLLHQYDKKIFASKKEYMAVKEYFNKETLYYDFYNSVSQLEKYLSAIKVPFFWTTWDKDLADSFDGYDVFDNYFKLGSFEKYAKDNIGPPLSLGKNSKYWIDGADYPNPHPGIMEHSFFAKQFDIKIGGI
jgi:hypothetical protein